MGSIDQEVGQTQKHFATITRVVDDTLKEKLRGAVFFKSDTLTGSSEYPEPAEPSFPLAGKDGEGFFWVPQVGDQIEVEINAEDENANPKYVRMLYSSEDDIPAEFKENYPFRMGWRTRAGHVLIFDNKPEALMVMFAHKIGTGFKWDKDGNEIKTIVKNLIESIGGDIKREIKGQVAELYKAEVKREYAAKVMETFKNDLVQEIQGALTGKAKKDVMFDAGAKATFKGKAGTMIGTAASMTDVLGSLVNLAGGGLPVAKVGSQCVGPGNLGIPVVSIIVDGSPKVTAP